MPHDDENSLGDQNTFNSENRDERDAGPESLGDEMTFAGGPGVGGPQSLGDEATFGGDSGSVDDAFDDDMATWMGHGLDVHRRIYLRWLSSSRRKESLQRRRGGGPASNRIQPFASVLAEEGSLALPEGITPELLEMALKLKAAGLG